MDIREGQLGNKSATIEPVGRTTVKKRTFISSSAVHTSRKKTRGIIYQRKLLNNYSIPALHHPASSSSLVKPYAVLLRALQARQTVLMPDSWQSLFTKVK